MGQGVDILVIGTGFAAFRAAIEAYDAGATDILIIEKAKANALGGNSIVGRLRAVRRELHRAGAPADILPSIPTPRSTVRMIEDIAKREGDDRANQDVLRALIVMARTR